MHSSWKSFLSEYIYRIHWVTSNTWEGNYPRTKCVHLSEPGPRAGRLRRQNCVSVCQVTSHARAFERMALIKRELKKKKKIISAKSLLFHRGYVGFWYETYGTKWRWRGLQHFFFFNWKVHNKKVKATNNFITKKLHN